MARTWRYLPTCTQLSHDKIADTLQQPNDEEEQERMDLVHHLFHLLMDGKLHLAPISKNPQRVLDIGTGTGIWAIDFAE
jgi:ubiquinone/menaquinone biosynthesis C-methylase UbiE